MKQLNIAVGIICNEHSELFITRRAIDAHMGGKLEFPGGKVEAGETPAQGLIRELREEVGIEAVSYELFEKVEHTFSDKAVTLFFYKVTQWSGEPWGKEGQSGEWMTMDNLNHLDFPPANAAIINRLKAQC